MANRNSTNPLAVGFVPDDTATTSTNKLAVGFIPSNIAVLASNLLTVGWIPVDPSSQMGTNYLVVGFIPVPDTAVENIIGASLQGVGLIGSFARARKVS